MKYSLSLRGEVRNFEDSVDRVFDFRKKGVIQIEDYADGEDDKIHLFNFLRIVDNFHYNFFATQFIRNKIPISDVLLSVYGNDKEKVKNYLDLFVNMFDLRNPNSEKSSEIGDDIDDAFEVIRENIKRISCN